MQTNQSYQKFKEILIPSRIINQLLNADALLLHQPTVSDHQMIVICWFSH